MNTLKSLPLCQETIDYVLSQPVQTGKTMLYGSSFFTRWGYDRARQQLTEATNGELDVLNHGFGGATIDQLLYMYPQLVAPYNPKEIVIRSGYNDINEGLTVDQSIFLLDRLITWLQKDFPGIRIYCFNYEPTLKGKGQDNIANRVGQEYNQLLEAFCANTENCIYVPMEKQAFFFEDPADIGDYHKIREDIFVADQVHLNPKGYAMFMDFVRELLDDLL